MRSGSPFARALAALGRAVPVRSLSAKLTLFYALLFAIALALLMSGARWGIERYAERIVAREMQAGSAAFERVAAMRYRQFGDSARVLAADFGFRTAVATGDAPTIASALDSLRRRLQLTQVFLVGIDGEVTGFQGTLSEQGAADVWEALDAGADRGVLRLDDVAYGASAVPVEAPVTVGWVVFGNRLDGRELSDIAKLSGIDLVPRLVPRGRMPRGIPVGPAGRGAFSEQDRNGERILVQASLVRPFGVARPQVLLLEYSLTDALAEYRPMLQLLLGFGLLCLFLVAFGSWLLARALTRPIKALDDAARRVSAGEQAQVRVETRDELGALAHSFNAMVRDIGERERRIAHMAFHDGLTGLANRALLGEHVGLALGRLKPGSTLALLCLDLDEFKAVNDTLGHPTGDAVLVEVAARLTAAWPGGFVARLGGDEFAVVLEGEGVILDQAARRILDALGAPLVIGGHRVDPGASLGIAIAPTDGEDVTALLKNADLALYRAKAAGKGVFRFFEPTMDREAQARRQMELDMRGAIADGQMFLLFQPLFNLAEGRVTSLEALLRWQHPTRGLIPPAEFIPLAESTGLIVSIGEWVLETACREAARWPDDVRVAVNVSAAQFRTPGLNAVVLRALARGGLSPDRLELEITESMFMDDAKTTLASLHSLRALGVRVALDDFGTGYSSLSYLRAFPFNKIKIDRSFIVDLITGDGVEAAAIIRSITTLAAALGMETTAEGVEHLGQLDIVREQGCSQIQGFYFSKPITPAEVLALFDAAGRQAA